METAMAAMTSIGSMAGSAGGAAGTSSLASSLGSMFGIVGGVAGGLLQRAEYQQKANEALIAAGQTKVESQTRQTQMKRELVRILAQNDVAIAAAGVDISSGIAQTNRRRQTQDTIDDISIERRDQEFRSALLRTRANNLRRAGNMALAGSVVSSASNALKMIP